MSVGMDHIRTWNILNKYIYVEQHIYCYDSERVFEYSRCAKRIRTIINGLT